LLLETNAIQYLALFVFQIYRIICLWNTNKHTQDHTQRSC